MEKENSFAPYRRFDSISAAQQFTDILEEKRIVYRIEEYEKGTGVSFYNLPEKEILVKLLQKDFDEANNIVLDETELNEADTNYHLQDFTDEELIEVLVKPHEWGEIVRTLAPKILKQRGYDLNSLNIEQRKEDYAKELSKPQKESSTLIIFGYIFAILGGWIGLAIGWGLDNLKTTLPDGKFVYTYTKEDRKHGARIFKLSVIMIVVYVAIYAALFLFQI